MYRLCGEVGIATREGADAARSPVGWVLLHGIGHHWTAWLPVLDRLAEAHDVIALDLPGFGRSPVPAAGLPPDMPGVVAAVAEVFTALGLDGPHVAGNSLGGAIALERAAAGRVAAVILGTTGATPV